MQIIRGVIGGVVLFLGRELNFLFAAGMAVLIGFRLTPLLPAQWPGWAGYVFLAVLGVIAAGISMTNERVGFCVSGFLMGGYIFSEYYAPNILTIPLFPFLMGAVIGTLLIGVLGDWALLLVSSLFGAYSVTYLFNLSTNAKILVTSGLFVIGTITQIILMHMQKKD